MKKECVLSRPSARAASLIGTIVVLTLVFLPLKAHALEVGDRVPDFHFLDRAGKEISYAADIRGVKPLYLVFWTTW